jgi:hypothetical protein
MPIGENLSTGFQGSETTSVEVTIYQHGDDPIVITSPTDSGIQVSGYGENKSAFNLVSVSTSKALGESSGTFQIQVKYSQEAESIFSKLVDDDWVDITFYRHDQPWHVMRGLIDTINEETIVAGTGATSEVYTITGRDFGKIWEVSPIWFSPYATADIITEAVANKVFGGTPGILGNPADAVESYMKDFLEEFAANNGPSWEPPPGMPSMKEGSFIGSVNFQKDHFQNVPARRAFNPNHLAPNGTMWSLAHQYSDPMFTELYVDLLPDGDPYSARLEAGEALSPADTQMTVVIRDKPFSVVDSGVNGWTNAWFDLPLFIVPRQSILINGVGRSGFERYNAYFVSSLLHQENGRYAISIIAPLVDMESVKRHGLRRLDIQSVQTPDNIEFVVMAEQQRRIMRDWYCLNPYFLNGTISLGMGRPDIKIGCRVRVPGDVIDATDRTYYVEQVQHNWFYGVGMRTNLGVTRGWIGTDADYLDQLEKISRKYTQPSLITAQDLSIATA